MAYTVFLSVADKIYNKARIMDPASVFTDLGIGTKREVKIFVKNRASIRVKIGMFNYRTILFYGGKRYHKQRFDVGIYSKDEYFPGDVGFEWYSGEIPPHKVKFF